MQDVLIVTSAVCCCISLSAVCADLHVPKCSSQRIRREPLSELESLVSIKFALEVVKHVLAECLISVHTTCTYNCCFSESCFLPGNCQYFVILLLYVMTLMEPALAANSQDGQLLSALTVMVTRRQSNWQKAASPPHTDGSVVFTRLHQYQCAPHVTYFLWRTRVHNPNGISIGWVIFVHGGSIVFARLRQCAPPSNTCFIGPTPLIITNCISNGSDVFGRAHVSESLHGCNFCRSKLPPCMGDLNTCLIHGCLGPSESKAKWRLGRFSRFCTAYGRESLYFAMVRHFPLKNCPFAPGIWTSI